MGELWCMAEGTFGSPGTPWLAARIHQQAAFTENRSWIWRRWRDGTLLLLALVAMVEGTAAGLAWPMLKLSLTPASQFTQSQSKSGIDTLTLLSIWRKQLIAFSNQLQSRLTDPPPWPIRCAFEVVSIIAGMEDTYRVMVRQDSTFEGWIPLESYSIRNALVDTLRELWLRRIRENGFLDGWHLVDTQIGVRPQCSIWFHLTSSALCSSVRSPYKPLSRSHVRFAAKLRDKNETPFHWTPIPFQSTWDHAEMPCGPEFIIGAIACALCSISGFLCLAMNQNKFGPPTYMVDPDFRLDNMAELPHEQMQRLETYIQRQRRMEAERILNARGDGAAQSAPGQRLADAARDGLQPQTGRTTVFIPQIYAQGRNTPQMTMPYLQRQQLRNHPYAGAAVY